MLLVYDIDDTYSFFEQYGIMGYDIGEGFSFTRIIPFKIQYLGKHKIHSIVLEVHYDLYYVYGESKRSIDNYFSLVLRNTNLYITNSTSLGLEDISVGLSEFK